MYSLVCNHPNLFETRPIISPLQTEGLTCLVPSLIWNMMDEEDVKVIIGFGDFDAEWT